MPYQQRHQVVPIRPVPFGRPVSVRVLPMVAGVTVITVVAGLAGYILALPVSATPTTMPAFAEPALPALSPSFVRAVYAPVSRPPGRHQRVKSLARPPGTAVPVPGSL